MIGESRKYIFSKFLVIGILILQSGVVFSQADFSTSRLLQSKMTKSSQLPFYKNIDFLENKAKGLPIIEGYQFRTETDEFELGQQEFLIRFNFNSKDERRAYEKVLSSNRNVYRLMQLGILNEKLEVTYQAIVGKYFSQEELGLVKEKLLILEDRRTILSKLLVNSKEVNITDWISNEEDLLELREDSLALEYEIAEANNLLFDEGATTNLDFSDFITLDKLEEVITTIPLDDLDANYEVFLANMKEDKALAEFDLEKAEAKKWLDFAQIKYQGDDKLSFQREVSIGTSINLPSRATNRVKRDEAALEVIERKYEKQIEADKTKREFLDLLFEMRAEIEQLKSLQKMVKELKLQETYDSYLLLDNVSPIILLELKYSIEKYKSKMLASRRKIYKLYIDGLSKTPYLIGEPRINYLSKSLIEY